MSSGGLDLFDVQSIERSALPPDAPVHKAGDGCVCLFTVSECDDPNAKLELCSICPRLHVGDGSTISCGLSPIPVTRGSRFRLSLGQAPDLAQTAPINSRPHLPIQYSFFRSVLECALRGSRSHESITIRYTRNKTSADVENTTIFSIELKVDHVEQPPQCTKHHALPSARCVDEGISAFVGDKKDPLENPSNDWNPELATHWSEQAWALKARGTWLVQHHTVKRKPTHDGSPKSTQSTAESQDLANNHVWPAAFVCYSRGLQFATLARSARETCASETGEADDVVKTQVAQTTSGLVDLDKLTEDIKDTVDISTRAITRLEFSLLLNLALCQLKAGSAEFAADNCTQALKLEPGWVDSVRDQEGQDQRIQNLLNDQPAISGSEVAKALYRRAQAYLRIGKSEEAKADLEAAIRLHRLLMANGSNTTGNNSNTTTSAVLAACEALLLQTVERISKDEAILVERLRKRRTQL